MASNQQQDLVQCTNSQDTAQAVGRCLCDDQLQQPGTWWSALWTRGPDPSMSDITCERLVARFCGTANTVDIPTVGHPRKVLRTFADTVAETALRFSSFVLTPQQVFLLNKQAEPQYLYLQGPPGTGKTVVLVLKALQWARRGKRVIVASESVNTALTILVEEHLGRMLGTAAAESIHRHSCDIKNVGNDVSGLVRLLGPGDPEAFVLFDDAPRDSDKFFQWLTARTALSPCVGRSVYRVDNDPTRPPPSWLEICTVTEPLRSPPEVTRQVERTAGIGQSRIPWYSALALPPPAEGPPVLRRRHVFPAGHSGVGPWECAECADTIGHLLSHEVRVGQPGAPQYRDTWILGCYLHDAREADILVRRLSGRRGAPVRAVHVHPVPLMPGIWPGPR